MLRNLLFGRNRFKYIPTWCLWLFFIAWTSCFLIDVIVWDWYLKPVATFYLGLAWWYGGPIVYRMRRKRDEHRSTGKSRVYRACFGAGFPHNVAERVAADVASRTVYITDKGAVADDDFTRTALALFTVAGGRRERRGEGARPGIGEPVIGFKYVRTYGSQLHSPAFEYVWHAGVNESNCAHRLHGYTDAEMGYCSCGFYSFDGMHIDELPTWRGGGHTVIIVEHLGVTVVHDEGYRSHQAKILGIAVRDKRSIKRLQQTYGDIPIGVFRG